MTTRTLIAFVAFVTLTDMFDNSKVNDIQNSTPQDKTVVTTVKVVDSNKKFVDIISSVNNKIDSTKIINTIVKPIKIESSKYDNVSPELLMAVLHQESMFGLLDYNSSEGAVGIAQIMPSTAQWVSDSMNISYSRSNLNKYDYNIKLSAWLLNWAIDKYNNVELALAEYNGGPRQRNYYEYYMKYRYTSEYRKYSVSDIDKKLRHLRKNKSYNSERIEFLNNVKQAKLLSKETKTYVASVIDKKKQYKQIMGDV